LADHISKYSAIILPMQTIQKISRQEYREALPMHTLIDTQRSVFFYKITFTEQEWYFDSCLDMPGVFIHSIESKGDTLLCADDRIWIFSPQGKLLLVLRIFEAVYFLREKGEFIFLFSERRSYKITTEDYCLRKIFFFSDWVVDVIEEGNGYKVICFDESSYFIQ